MEGLESALLSMLVENVPGSAAVLVFLGLFVVVGQALVLLTPTKKDDAVMEKLHGLPLLGGLLKALEAFAPLQKKDK